ncbi:MAG: hypothetical protein AAF152_12595 [Cyanobacteria bacterium P01_A01_bin.114]
MAQSTVLLEVSCPDDAKAIATLMNQALRPEGARVKVQFKAGRLNILLECDRSPSRQRLIPLVAKQIKRLRLNAVDQIYVYGRRRDTKAVVWGTILRQPADADQPPEIVIPTRPLSVISRDPVGATSTANEERFLERIRLVLVQAIARPDILIDVELEGLDLLISLEASQPLDIRSLIKPIRQALAKRSLGNLKVAKIYYRHAETQRIIPIKAINLKR